MDAKLTLIIGAGLLVVGLVLAGLLWAPVKTVFWGTVALLLLFAGLLILAMGYVQVREDRGAIERERAETAEREAMAAREV